MVTKQKKLLSMVSILFLMVSLTYSFAQTEASFKTGITIGQGQSTFTSNISGADTPITGLIVGVFLEQKISNKSLIGIQANYSRRGTSSVLGDTQVKFDYIEFPLCLTILLGKEEVIPFILVGGYYAYNIVSKADSIYQKIYPSEYWRKHDAGIRIGTGVIIFDSVRFDIQYGKSLIDEVAVQFISSTTGKAFSVKNRFVDFKIGITTNLF